MDVDALVPLLREAVPGLVACYLFGSQAGGTAGAESDVDLAVLGERRLTEAERWELQATLASHFGSDVDVVDLLQASDVLRVQVIDGGRLLYDGAPSARARFEALALSAYARLNEERRGILEDIKQRGNVFGAVSPR